ncbi:MAG TPA: hypothetical protein VGJ20_33160 [Xanthobacteraceae bacterium]|jgi:hypothetical protein
MSNKSIATIATMGIDIGKKRLHHNVLAIALANKLARIANGPLEACPLIRP